MNIRKYYTYFCFITYPIAITFIALSKFQESYDTEFLICGLVLAICDTLGIVLYICDKKEVITQK
jgi:hypothetical protein